MGAEGAVNIIFRNDIKEAKDAKETRQRCRRVSRQIRQPYKAAELGYVDEIIEPRKPAPKSSGLWIF